MSKRLPSLFDFNAPADPAAKEPDVEPVAELGATALSSAFFGFAGISSLDLILEERSVFCREIQGKFYTPLAYYLSKVLVDGLMLR